MKITQENKVKVSIVIPIYNVERYLRQCLDSVVNQTLKEIEIICVDDGSTDSSPEIMQSMRLRTRALRSLQNRIPDMETP